MIGKFILSALSRIALLVVIFTCGNLTYLQLNQEPTSSIIAVAVVVFILGGAYIDVSPE